MSQFGDPEEDFKEALKGALSPHDRERFKHLARQIHHAYALGTRKQNHIGSLTFADEDKRRVVHALLRAAYHGL